MRRKTTQVYKRPFPWEYVIILLLAPFAVLAGWFFIVLLFSI